MYIRQREGEGMSYPFRRRIKWAPPNQIDGLGAWLWNSWKHAEPITQRRYLLWEGFRIFGLEVETRVEKEGMVL